MIYSERNETGEVGLVRLSLRKMYLHHLSKSITNIGPVVFQQFYHIIYFFPAILKIYNKIRAQKIHPHIITKLIHPPNEKQTVQKCDFHPLDPPFYLNNLPHIFSPVTELFSV